MIIHRFDVDVRCAVGQRIGDNLLHKFDDQRVVFATGFFALGAVLNVLRHFAKHLIELGLAHAPGFFDRRFDLAFAGYRDFDRQ